jgi:predicted histidine transporter YuiF (NhaC family)
MNILTAHPKLVTFGIGLAITFGIGLAFGTIDHNQAFAAPSYGCDEGVGI